MDMCMLEQWFLFSTMPPSFGGLAASSLPFNYHYSAHHSYEDGGVGTYLTGNFNIDFLNKVPSGQTAIVEVQERQGGSNSKSGRKKIVSLRLLDPTGKVYIKAEATIIKQKSSSL